MRKLLAFGAFAFILLSAHSQMTPPWINYYGSTVEETKEKFFQYLVFHQYNADIIETDTTIEMTITHDSASWIIYSVFFFDSTGKCYSFENRRCDSIGPYQLQSLLDNKDLGLRKIGANKYISRRRHSELLEILYYPSCTRYRRTRLNLSRKEYRALRGSNQDEAL